MSGTITFCFAALLVAAVALSPVACTMTQQNLVANAIKDGVNPIDAKCAIEMGAERAQMCLARASARK